MANRLVTRDRLCRYRKVKPCHFCRGEISKEGDALKVTGTRGRTKYYHVECALRAGFSIPARGPEPVFNTIQSYS